MAYDIEDLLADVKTILTNNLNTKIAAINTAKNDGISLSSINASAYFFQTLDNKFASYNPFVFYGIVDVASNDNGRYSSQEFTISVMIVAVDDESGEAMTKKMIRYGKALKEVFQENWQSTGLGNKLVISSFIPNAISGLNETQEHRVAAIELKTSVS